MSNFDKQFSTAIKIIFGIQIAIVLTIVGSVGVGIYLMIKNFG